MTIKVYAVADVVPESCDYITAGKEYEVVGESMGRFFIVDDTGETIGDFWDHPAHIAQRWRRVAYGHIPPALSTDTTFWQAAYLTAIRAGNPEPWTVANIAAKKLEERK